MAKEHKRKIVIAQSTTKFRMAALREQEISEHVHIIVIIIILINIKLKKKIYIYNIFKK